MIMSVSRSQTVRAMYDTALTAGLDMVLEDVTELYDGPVIGGIIYPC